MGMQLLRLSSYGSGPGFIYRRLEKCYAGKLNNELKKAVQLSGSVGSDV